MYDRDQSGSLSTLELRTALNAAGYKLNYRVLNALVLRYGTRGGTLGFDDFIMCTIKLKTMIGKSNFLFNHLWPLINVVPFSYLFVATEAFKERDPYNTKRASFTLDEWIDKTLYS